MTLHSWRIVKAKHAANAFTGEGAKLAGGRWNSRGTLMIYTAQSASLAMLEMLVHLQAEEILRHYVLFEVSFEARLVQTLPPGNLLRNWRSSPPPLALQKIGDAWIAAQKTPILQVPSVIVPTESNYLLNPAHPDFGQVAIGPKQAIRFDPRLT